MRSLQDLLQHPEQIVWVFRGVYGKRVKWYAVNVGLANGKLRSFQLPTEAETVSALASLREVLPDASVGWDSDAYIDFRFRKRRRLQQGRLFDIPDDTDSGFRGYLLWRVLKPILIPAVPLTILAWIFTREPILMPILSRFAEPGSDEFLQLAIWFPRDEVTFAMLGATGAFLWVGFLGFADRSKGRLKKASA